MTTVRIRLTDRKPCPKVTLKYVTQTIIDSHAMGEELSDGALKWFKWLAGRKFESIRRAVNPEYPSDPRHLRELVDGQWEALSWNKLITPRSLEQEIYSVMRKAVDDQRDEFFIVAMDAGHPCQSCGCGDSQANPLQADHAGKPFSTIAAEWLSVEGQPALEDVDVGFRFADADDEASWIIHHAGNTVWQVLCRSCNASKGNRG